jgi:glycosyltransferase involved in cell wall biosynthesis|tara:strand:+ start:10350 stop:11591 length:1242 start_codon:yes stop_codon:yes gene_type:complete
MNEKSRKKVVFLLVPPNFFGHRHFHERKLAALRSVKVPAKAVAFVPESLFQARKEAYKSVNSDDFDIVTYKRKISKSFLMAKYFYRELALKRHVIVHALRETTVPLIILRKCLFLSARLKIAQEFEGDNRSEFIYNKEFCDPDRPPDYPKKLSNVIKYKIIAFFDFFKAQNADALILMSKEHAELWTQRLVGRKKMFIFPTLPLPDDVFFDRNARAEIRKNLGVDDKIIFVYVGNVTCTWQRLSGMFKVFKEISEVYPTARFLVLTRVEDFKLVKDEAKNFNVEDRLVLKNVPHEEVYKYLSASDLGLFLRHSHIMNKVVTSGKLGEYLASGLPVVTTGANSRNLNDFIKMNDMGVFVDDNLGTDVEIEEKIEHIVANLPDYSERNALAVSFHESMNLTNVVNIDYPRFLTEL